VFEEVFYFGGFVVVLLLLLLLLLLFRFGLFVLCLVLFLLIFPYFYVFVNWLFVRLVHHGDYIDVCSCWRAADWFCSGFARFFPSTGGLFSWVSGFGFCSLFCFCFLLGSCCCCWIQEFDSIRLLPDVA